ncbi:hypothetical protein BKA93DRAFT_797975 [Sparassis latifolia]
MSAHLVNITMVSSCVDTRNRTRYRLKGPTDTMSCSSFWSFSNCSFKFECKRSSSSNSFGERFRIIWRSSGLMPSIARMERARASRVFLNSFSRRNQLLVKLHITIDEATTAPATIVARGIALAPIQNNDCEASIDTAKHAIKIHDHEILVRGCHERPLSTHLALRCTK